ncbi:MAG TPA: RodZ domain-containing protein, partial [Acidimicrobiales bacterium]|nr:RodZ domain-containing protein [Acidimicrobiales bacterium]
LVHQGWSGRTWADHGALDDPGDTHLRPFTSTAQVPVVGGRRYEAVNQFVSTGVVPAVVVWPRPRVPLALRLLVWLVAVLLAAAIAGLVIHKVRPKWLRAVEVTAGAAQPAAHASSGTGSKSSTTHSPAGRQTHPHPTAPVSETSTGLNNASVAVAAPDYDVVVTTQAACWVEVTGPGSFKPTFSSVLPAGSTRTFPSTQGQLTVLLGASHVVVQVQMAGKTVPGWQFTPTAVPFTLNFSSAG